MEGGSSFTRSALPVRDLHRQHGVDLPTDSVGSCQGSRETRYLSQNQEPKEVTSIPLLQESPFPITPPSTGTSAAATHTRLLPANRLLQPQFPNRFRRDSPASIGKELGHRDIKKLNQSCPASLGQRLGESQGLLTPAACHSHQPAPQTLSPALCPAPGQAGDPLFALSLWQVSLAARVLPAGIPNRAPIPVSKCHGCPSATGAFLPTNGPCWGLRLRSTPANSLPTNADKQVLCHARHRGVGPTGALQGRGGKGRLQLGKQILINTGQTESATEHGAPYLSLHQHLSTP